MAREERKKAVRARKKSSTGISRNTQSSDSSDKELGQFSDMIKLNPQKGERQLYTQNMNFLKESGEIDLSRIT